MERKFPTSAFFISIENVSVKFETLKLATSLGADEFLSKVPSLMFIVFNGACIFKAKSSSIAEAFAPVSRRAYVGHDWPPAETNTGTVGLMAV